MLLSREGYLKSCLFSFALNKLYHQTSVHYILIVHVSPDSYTSIPLILRVWRARRVGSNTERVLKGRGN